jgi:hypothetical protein
MRKRQPRNGLPRAKQISETSLPLRRAQPGSMETQFECLLESFAEGYGII